MIAGKIVGFDANKIKAQLLAASIEEQNRRFIAYAKEKILEIGDRIKTYNAANHLDRTGNLLNSLVWGVVYNGKLIERGFYRNADSMRESYLHEWSGSDISSMFPVDGHERARKFSTEYARSCGKGWRVFFAILAPYWGYWESGFRIKSGGKAKFMQFQVMSQVFDEVRMELKPAETHLTVNVPHYEGSNRKYKNKKYTNLKKKARELSDNPYKESKWFSKNPRNRRRRL